MVERLGWASITFGLMQVLRLANNVVLARLLAPSLFGLMTIVNAIREVVEESAGANGTYSPKGHKGQPEGDSRFSVTYNESI